MAEEYMIDITSIAGSGPRGRIVRDDIEKAIDAKKGVAVTPVVYQGKRVKSTIPLQGMRKVIAELLKDNPIINSSLIDNEIKLWENINVAVALEDRLIVPVVKDADKKSLVEISRTVRTLKEKAREGKLVLGDTTSGTFTITNLGALGGGYCFETVIINQPESAILGTGGITDRVIARDGQIVIRPIMTYYLTYDHRVINGAVAAKFMANVPRLLENPNSFISLAAS